MSTGGGTLLRGAAANGGGAGGAGGGSSSKATANGGATAADGVLSVTPDSPADSEWRSRRGPLDGVGEISGPWGEEDSTGLQPTDLYGKFTWKIENFSEISKRELRSNVFEVGNYKWYILVYPQGCDVHNHLSLFLCVADYDKLLPGWSHFAQFTIAVVNKDPKKSKYSDTLHRFCKKEHDWGWKKFMELSKVLDGFTVADTLVIKAQVQVIHEKPARPFRCLEPQYRRELVRVYLTNVEGICRRFLEEKRETLAKLQEDKEKWSDMREFLQSANGKAQAALAVEKADTLLKGIVKRFFNEKEVTSTLVMDALYCGCRALDVGNATPAEAAKTFKPGRSVWLSIAQNKTAMCGDLLASLERASSPSLFDLDEDSEGGSEDFGNDAVERDERRLAELGRRTIEMYALHHLFTTKVEVSFAEAQAIKMQEALIAEEEEAERVAAEIEGAKKSKKAKQKQRKKDKKEAEEAELAAKMAEEEAERARIKAEKEAKAAEERKAREAARAAQLAEEERLAAEAAAAAAARAAAEKAEREKRDRERAEAAAAAAAAAEAAAAEAAAAAAAAAAEEASSGDEAEMHSATGSQPAESEEDDSPVSPDPPSSSKASVTSSPVSAEQGRPAKTLPVPRPLTNNNQNQGSSPAAESPGRSAAAANDSFEETVGKRGKKASKASEAAAQPSPKKQLPSPRTAAGGSGAGSPASTNGVASAEMARVVAGDGPLGAVEAAALRAHAQQLENALSERVAEVARLKRELERASQATAHLGGDGRASPAPALGGVGGTPPMSPARNLGGDGSGDVGARGPSGMSGKRGGDGSGAGGPPVPPGPPPPSARAAPPLPPGPPPGIAAANGDAPPPPPPGPPPPRGPPPPGQARDGDSPPGMSGPPGSYAGAAGGLRRGAPPPPPGMPPPAPPGGPPGMMAAPPPPPGVPPGMQTPQGKMSHYGMHPQASPGLEDDFQHLGMIADLLDDSPGGGFF